MNIKGVKGRGAYSAIVYQEGDLVVAEDNVGTVLGEDADARTVILAALPASGGKVYLVEGIYSIAGGSVGLKPNMTLDGAGIGATVLEAANGLNDRVLAISPGTNNVSISNLTVDGNSANQSDGWRNGIITYNNSDTHINNVRVYDTYDCGLLVTGSVDAVISNSVFDECAQFTANHNVIVYNASHRGRILNCLSKNCNHMGFYFGSSDAGSIIGCVGKDNGLEGFCFSGGKGHRIEGCYAEGNNDAGITVASTLGATVVNNVCNYNDNDGILVAGAHFTSVEGNVCNGNGQSAGTYAGIALVDWDGGIVLNASIIGNICHDDQGAKTQDYGIRTSAYAHDYYIIRNNVLEGNGTAGLLDSGTGANKDIGANLS